MQRHIFGFFSLVLVGAMSNGCGGFELQSAWRQNDIVVDGEAGDWAGALTYDEKSKADIGIVNDESDLYICFIPREQSVQNQIMVRGLTLWFDSEGGKAERFGVRFPLGLLESGGMESLMGSMHRGNTETRIQMIEDFERSLTHLEVLREDTMRVSLDEIQGIEAAASIPSASSLIYEIRVPLRTQDGQPLAIGVSPGGVVGVGLETPEIDRGALHQGAGRRGAMTGEGGSGGMPMGERGGMRGGRGGGRPEIPEPLKAWGKLHLASNADRG